MNRIMYFEDLYEKINPLWKDRYSLRGIKEAETYVPELAKHFSEIDDYICSVKANQFNDWHGMLAFTMYQAMTEYALSVWRKKKSTIIITSDISIITHEKLFRRNLEYKDEDGGNLEYLRQYQGFENKQNKNC